MKHAILSLAMVLLFGLAYAQNMVLNGDLEAWDNTTTPTDWTKAENITQATSPVHGGTYSAMHTSGESTRDFQQEITGVSEGVNYTINYYYLDNDPNARTRIWSYWLEGTNTLPAHADELRPGEYSSDNPEWQEFSVTLTAPAGADGFRFEVRVYKDNNIAGGAVYYDDFSFEPDEVFPEPTNYPSDFEAAADGLSIDLSWTDASGAQLPGAYLILASDEDNIQAPADGNAVSDDPDLADGSAALNIAYGVQECGFDNLQAGETYYFEIYPYTNGGQSIDYKNDGTAPAAQATTADIEIIESEDFDTGWGDWEAISITGDQVWERDNDYGMGGTPCARISGYSGGCNENEDWLISPAMDFTSYESETLHFYSAKNYDGQDLEVLISTNYDGGGDPVTADWTPLLPVLSAGSWDWTASGNLDISAYDDNPVYVAFKYLSDNSECATWEVDDILITGEGGLGAKELFFNETDLYVYPNPASGTLFIHAGGTINTYLAVVNTLGEVVYRGKIKNTDATLHIDISGWAPGLYLVHTYSGQERSGGRKIIVK
ncbi:MAG: choice-of-anchor J domain-containing protein [Bacteroidales bacterium]